MYDQIFLFCSYFFLSKQKWRYFVILQLIIENSNSIKKIDILYQNLHICDSKIIILKVIIDNQTRTTKSSNEFTFLCAKWSRDQNAYQIIFDKWVRWTWDFSLWMTRWTKTITKYYNKNYLRFVDDMSQNDDDNVHVNYFKLRIEMHLCNYHHAQILCEIITTLLLHSFFRLTILKQKSKQLSKQQDFIFFIMRFKKL